MISRTTRIDVFPTNTTANVAADAVGMAFSEEKRWFVAIVKHGNEKICGKRLTELGYENYIPVQRVFRQYASGRKKWVYIIASRRVDHEAIDIRQCDDVFQSFVLCRTHKNL